jgi:hypothetical protein
LRFRKIRGTRLSGSAHIPERDLPWPTLRDFVEIAAWIFCYDSRAVTWFARTSVRLLGSLLCLHFAYGQARPPAAATLPMPPFVVIGFLGGFVKHDDLVHSTVQLAARLRKDYPSGVSVATFQNRQGDQAREHVLHLLDTDHDGKLSAEEKRNARVIIYGHSWGASQTVALARQLERDGIRVMLTIQVDSVSKPGEEDGVIPANVSQAANFYQPSGFIHGQRQIRAADPAHTEILGNFRFDYSNNHIHCNEYPWLSRFFMRAHIEIECDPEVWTRVESLIRAKLPVVPERAVAAN